jgi:hypothetical protein
VNLGENGPTKIITRSDLKASMQSYENVSLLFPRFVVPVQKGGNINAHMSSLFSKHNTQQTRLSS